MLKIVPVRDKSTEKAYCDALGIQHDPDLMSYAAFDDDAFTGLCLFRIVGKSCVIFQIKLVDDKDDYLATYLLAKAPMNFADLCGIKTAIFKDSNESLAKALGFRRVDGELIVSLEGYFTTPCKSCSESKDSEQNG